jgi:putative FmdB family regulatory protein
MPMPTYEYVCTDCGTPLEVVQSIHDPALTECPACSGGRLRKVFGNVGVVFKGSGFYRTDSRGKKTAGAPATPKPDAAAGKGSTTSTAPSGSDSSTGAGSGSSGGAGSSAGSTSTTSSAGSTS